MVELVAEASIRRKLNSIQTSAMKADPPRTSSPRSRIGDTTASAPGSNATHGKRAYPPCSMK